MKNSKKSGMKAIHKEFFRTIFSTFNRFLAVAVMVGLGVAFFSGLRATQPDMEQSVDQFYDNAKFYDFWVKGTMGITTKDIEIMEQTEGVESVEGVYTTQAYCKTQQDRYVSLIYSGGKKINQLQKTLGRLPSKSGECFVDDKFLQLSGLKIGDKIRFEADSQQSGLMVKDLEYKIVGSGYSPLFLTLERGSSTIGGGTADCFFYLVDEDFTLPIYTDAYITGKELKEEVTYYSTYDKKVKTTSKKILKSLTDLVKKEEVDTKKWVVLTREHNQTYLEYEADAKRIGAIGGVFPIIFFLVAALVALTTMTRMVEEERAQIGTLKALGYSNWTIASKYLWYGLFASLLGGFIGLVAGQKFLPMVIISAYQILYVNLPDILTPVSLSFSAAALAAAVACTTLATIVACYKELMASPADLMRPASPRPGKRVLMERIKFVWKRLNFTKKATLRNLFRYKKRLLMTLFGIAGCTGLLVVGFGLRDAISKVGATQYKDLITYDAEFTQKDNVLDVENKDLVKNKLDQDSQVKDYTLIAKEGGEASRGKIKKQINIVVPKDNKKLKNYITLRERKSQKELKLSDQGVIITEKLALMLDAKTGDNIQIKQENEKQYTAKVVGITENYYLNYIYMTENYYEKISKQTPKFLTFIMNNEQMSEKEEKDMGEAYMKDGQLLQITFYRNLSEKIMEMLESMNGVIWVLVGSAGLLAFVVLYNLNNINVTERKRELSTLKVLGFYDGEVSAYILRENFILTTLGSLLGLVVGTILTRYVATTAEVDILMFGRQINVSSYMISVALTFVFAAIVNVGMHLSLKKIDMIEALKSVE